MLRNYQKKRNFLGDLLGILLFLGMASGAIAAEPMPKHAVSHGSFARIEQPPSVKFGVTVGGALLIGLELWWFLRRKPSH